MADAAIYSSAYVLVNGRLLSEEVSVSIKKNSGLNPVFTVAKGLAGFSQGAQTAEITVDNAVPSADFEMNPDDFMKAGAIVEIGVVMANRQSVFKGAIMEADYSHGVNAESKMSFRFMAGFEAWE